MHWRERWKRVREDARVFWRSVRRKELRDHLVGRRQALVAEFDALQARWVAEQRPLRGRAEGQGPHRSD